jgi:hypothetical protein
MNPEFGFALETSSPRGCESFLTRRADVRFGPGKAIQFAIELAGST